jgi:hypothetical protein
MPFQANFSHTSFCRRTEFTVSAKFLHIYEYSNFIDDSRLLTEAE